MSKQEQKKRFKTMDDTIDGFMDDLSDFHSAISKFAIKNSDGNLELAISKISESMTALHNRSRFRASQGIHGKEKS